MVVQNESSALSTKGIAVKNTDHPDAPIGAGVTARYLEPDWFTRRIFNPIVARSTRWGISLWGSRVLSVPGRVSGEIRSTPVNVLTVDDRRYLVAPRGETQWVLNVRAAGECTLRVGRRTETVRLEELDDQDKPAVLRPYLRRWKWEVGQFFDGVGPDSTDAELLAIAPNHPVFEIQSI
jgi:deazaflavin-dependent oxidoreductase (nitroreductase family)